MKKTTIKDRIEEIQNAETKLIQGTRTNIEDLKAKLEKVAAQLEETYTSGDVSLGEKLVSERSMLSSKIEYLESFLKKRESVSLISEGEALKLKTELNDEMESKFISDREKINDLLAEMEGITESGLSKMNEIRELGNSINRLQKKNHELFGIDSRINGMYSTISQFVTRYKINTMPSVNSLEKKR